MKKNKYIDMAIVIERVQELTNATYGVYCTECYFLGQVSLTYDEYLEKVRIKLLKNRKEEK